MRRQAAVGCKRESTTAPAARSAEHAGKPARQQELQLVWELRARVYHIMVTLADAVHLHLDAEPVRGDLLACVQPGLVLVGCQ